MANEFSHNLNDAAVSPAAIALPNAGGGNIGSVGIDLNAVAPFLASCEVEIQAPALTTARLPDAQTMTYDAQDSADNVTFADIAQALIVQTGAGGIGSLAVTDRYRIPSNVRRYLRIQATNSGGGADASGANLIVKLLF